MRGTIYIYYPMTEQAPNMLTFGRHKGKTIEEVFDSDPNYCRWLLNQEVLTHKSEAIQAFLKTKFVRGAGSPIMTWGKYKNKSLDWIKTSDRPYLEWLRRNEFVIEKCPKLLEGVVAALA